MSVRKLLAPALLFFLTLLFAPCAPAQSDARSRAAAEIESLRAQIKAKEAALLAPPAEDRKTYAEFLAQPDTGLLRLLPREKWDGKLSVNGGGAYYSFAKRTHEYGYGSDIELQQDSFSVGFAGADFGFMLNLGDVPIETLSDEVDPIRYMASFQTPLPEPEARKAQMLFMGQQGAQSGEWTYKNRAPVVVGSTYVVRSINYHYSDVLVAFHVVRKDTDGSVVLLWKTLRKYPKPELESKVAASNGS